MAIQLPNGKITRTLPEQVGFNTQKIEEIIQFLNESGLKDLVINLEASSGTLSAEQYAIAELSPSYVIFDGGVFYKVFEDSDYIDYFLLLEKVSTENSDLDVSHWRIRVERDSRNYSLDNINIFTSYNKSQLDSFFAAKASLSGADFVGPITSPSIVENMGDGYSFTKNANLAANGISLNYVGVVKNGNKLTFAIAGTFSPNTGVPIEANVIIGAFLVPADILNKLYPNSLGALSNQAVLLFDGTTSAVSKYARTSKGGTSITFTLYGLLSGFTQGSTYEFRIETTFLLSDNLAS